MKYSYYYGMNYARKLLINAKLGYIVSSLMCRVKKKIAVNIIACAIVIGSFVLFIQTNRVIC